jgi:hypothetical protein
MALAYVIGRLKARYTRVAILNLTFLVAGVVLVVFGRSGDALEGQALWIVVLAALVPLGLLLALAQSVLNAIVEVKVDAGMEGAVFALYAIVYTVLAPIGGIALAQFADQNDVWDALTLAGAVVVAAAAGALVFWRRPPADGPEVDAASVAATGRFFTVDAMLQSHLLHLHRSRPQARDDAT